MFRHAKPRVFLEGIQVPFMGASIQYPAAGPSQASFTLKPSPSLRRIRPKTHAICTIRDEFYGKDIVLFEGEVSGVGKNRGSSERYFQVQCVDMLFYLSQYYTQWMDQYFLFTQDARPMDITDSIVAQKIENHGRRLADGMKGILSDALGVRGALVGFFRRANDKYKLQTRLRGAQGTWIVDDPSGFRQYIASILSVYGFGGTLMDAFTGLAGLIEHGLMSIGAPPDGKTPANWAVRPFVYYALPPACNIIPPRSIYNYSDSRSFLSAATRFIGFSTPTSDIKPDGVVHYTQTMFAFPADIATSNPKEEKNFITAEELERGPFPVYRQNFVPAVWHAEAGFQKRRAKTMFEMENLTGGSATASLSFHPYLVPGLPALLVDSDGEALIGHLDGVQHQIGVESWSTSVSMSMVRRAEDFKPSQPVFLDANWTPDNIGAGYRSILGDSVRSAKEMYNTSSMPEIVKGVLADDAKADGGRFSRAIIGLHDYFSGLGAEPDGSGAIFTGAPFEGPGSSLVASGKIPDRQSAVHLYLKDLGRE